MIQITFNQNTIEYLLIILVRVSSFVFIAPFFGDSAVPARVKVSFSVLITILLFYSMPVTRLEYGTVIDYAIIVVKESITGLSMAQVFDPTTNTEIGLTGSLYSYLLMLFMIVSNMHIFLLNALVDSYTLIPINGIKLGDTMYDTVMGFMVNYFVIGFRIVLPVFASILLLNCILGIMAKVAPQMNMFAVGMQLKVMVGLFVMFITVSVLPVLSNFIFSHMQIMIKEMLRGMM